MRRTAGTEVLTGRAGMCPAPGRQIGQVTGQIPDRRIVESRGCVGCEVARTVREARAPISSMPPLEGGTDRVEATVRGRRAGRLGVTDRGGRGWVSERMPAMAPVRPGATLGWLVGRRGWAHVKVRTVLQVNSSTCISQVQGSTRARAR
jgi:hypothetical protein